MRTKRTVKSTNKPKRIRSEKNAKPTVVVMPVNPSKRLAYVNYIVLAIILVINAYTVSIPFLPSLFDRPDAPTVANTRTFTKKAIAKATAPSSQTNRLIIPGIQLDQEIFGGTDTYTGLDKGVWRWSGGSSPDKGSNTVLLGHRFTYTKPQGVFYFLDRLQLNDTISVVWSNRTYRYRITETKVVPPSATEILAPTTKPTLTMYTCTPLWNPVNRLVIIAVLEQ